MTNNLPDYVHGLGYEIIKTQLTNERDAAIARAEAAEGEHAAFLDDIFAVLDTDTDGDTESIIAAVAALRRRVAELEAGQEAARFRYDEDPPAGVPVDAIVHGATCDAIGHWHAGGEAVYCIDGWRPAPP